MNGGRPASGAVAACGQEESGEVAPLRDGDLLADRHDVVLGTRGRVTQNIRHAGHRGRSARHLLTREGVAGSVEVAIMRGRRIDAVVAEVVREWNGYRCRRRAEAGRGVG